jgi:RsiW-degrading membrane proteinase PrsW (M82 family)
MAEAVGLLAVGLLAVGLLAVGLAAVLLAAVLLAVSLVSVASLVSLPSCVALTSPLSELPRKTLILELYAAYLRCLRHPWRNRASLGTRDRDRVTLLPQGGVRVTRSWAG